MINSDSIVKRDLLRIPLIALQAAFVTALLIMLMVVLTEGEDEDSDMEKRIKLPDIFMPEVEIETQRLVEKPEKPEVDETPPPDIPEQDFDQIDGNAAVGNIATGRIRANLDLNIDSGLQVTDGEYLPIVKIAPQYPRRALSRGIEGYVIVEYIVTKQGTVKNPVVIEADPENIFNRAAIKSALRYKYKPRVIDGEPIEVQGVRTKITFKVEK